MRRIDYHLHTLFSADSKASVEGHIQKAIEEGLDEICFTDHYDVNYPGTPFILDIENYTHTLNEFKKKYQDKITIKIGIELGLDPIYKNEIEQVAKSYPFDYIIGSIHAIGLEEFVFGGYFEGKSKEEAHHQYFRQALECVKEFDCFNCFGHYDYIERYGIYDDNRVDTDAYWPLIDEFLKVLIAKGKGLEVNTSGFLLRGEGFPKKSILSYYHELGGKIITIGSDSHESSRVGQHVDDVIKLLEEIGFEDVSTFTKQKRDIS